MSRAHSLLAQSRWEGASLDELLAEEIEAYNSAGKVFSVAGPAVKLTPKAAIALSLAIHELVTNAAKYGALSVGSGSVNVTWRFDSEGAIDFEWRESGGPEVSAPQRRGFGSTLIERALALEIGGRSRLVFDRAGLICSLLIPSASMHGRASPELVRTEQPSPAADVAEAASQNVRILVVEDSALVLMGIEDVILTLGWEVVGPAMRVAQAVPLAREEALDAALLDVNLDGEMSWEVAAILQDRGIPFVFTTGYDGASILPERFAGLPVLNKPFGDEDVEQVLVALLRNPAVRSANGS